VQSSPAQRTKRSTRQAHGLATPFSNTAARLIAQIQAEARAALLKELSAKDGVIVLHPLDVATRRVRHTGRTCEVTDGRGTEYYAFRQHLPDANSQRHPSHWIASVRLVDGAGRDWNHHIGTLVCDDFGNLVEVSA
jgi:hypothetical protein